MRLLIVEDDAVLGGALHEHLKRVGFDPVLASDGADADHLLAVERFDLVVLDLGLPSLNGLEVLRRLRHSGDQIPVLIVTARDALSDRVKGFERGADDYLCKPFEIAELVARARALMRRSYGVQADELRVGALRLNVRSRLVTVGTVPVVLSARELEVLETLMLREGHVVSKDELLQRMYDNDSEVGTNAVEVFLHRIRRKTAGSGVVIRTIRGLGYLLERDRAADA